jgi:hypothetical protein
VDWYGKKIKCHLLDTAVLRFKIVVNLWEVVTKG